MGRIEILCWVWDQEMADRLGATLKRLRNDRGLSQETLAYRAGITKNQVQLLEAGRASGALDKLGPSNPKLATLKGLAVALELSVSEMMATADL